MNRFSLPIAFAVVLLVSLTLVEAKFSDRWRDSSVTADEFDKQFAQVPKETGPWKGVDLPVADVVKKTAGAISYVSRQYTHTTTGRRVTLWLIVGHSRDICRHTPDICYPGSGYTQMGGVLTHRVELKDQEPSVFFSARFKKEDAYGQKIERVFWAWNRSDIRLWEAPTSQRLHYGNSQALYKLYFTSNVMADETTIDKNAAAEFAELMLPIINEALFEAEETTTEQATEELPAA